MQCEQRADRKIIAFERGEYGGERNRSGKQGKKKLSGTMALILSFAAVYFGVVAGLTDK